MPTFVIACYPWSGTQENQLSLEAGKVYEIVQQTDNGWARGHDLAGKEGFFPSSFVKVCSDEEVQHILNATGANQPSETPEPEPATNEPASAQPAPVETNQPVSADPVPSATPAPQEEQEKPSTTKPPGKLSSSQRGSKSRISTSSLAKKDKESSTSDKKKKKKKTSSDKESTSKRKRSKRKDHDESMNTVRRLQEFEERNRQTELSWSTERIKDGSNMAAVLTTCDEVKKVLDLQHQYEEKLQGAVSECNAGLARTLVDAHVSDLEACEWDLFERHQALKAQWEARGEAVNAQLEIILGHLDRLVKLQQAQCFEPDQVEDDINTLLEEIRKRDIIEFPRDGAAQLDETIARFRAKADEQRSTELRAETMCKFYDGVTNALNVTVFHLTLCELLTNILACATTVHDTLQKQVEAGEKTTENQTGELSQLLRALLYTDLTVHRLNVPFASLLCKIVASWGALTPDLHEFVIKGSSLTELFAQTLSFEFVRAYRAQIELLSTKGAHDFAQSVAVRFLTVVANGHLDLTRSPIIQLVVKAPLTVTPGHTRPSETGQTNVLIHGSAVLTLVFTAVLETQALVQAKTTQAQKFSESGGQVPALEKVPDSFTESEILMRSGWQVNQQSPPLVYLLTYPKLIQRPELGLRTASDAMLKLLEEMGWQPLSNVGVPLVKAANSSPRSEATKEIIPPSSSAGTLAEVKQQMDSQAEMIQQQTNAIDQLTQFIRALQGQLQAEKQSRLALESQVQQLSAQLQGTGTAPSMAPLPTPPVPVAAPEPEPVPVRALEPLQQDSDTEEIEDDFELEESETASASYEMDEYY